MIYALDDVGNRITPKPHTQGICPSCNTELIPKCGMVNIWHWSHKASNNCNYKPESEWHLKWKLYFESLGCQIEQRIGNNIADVVLSGKHILELQNSPISSEEIINRCVNASKNGYKIVRN